MTCFVLYVVISVGIRIQNLQPGQIIMDIDFRWGGDPSIILAVDAVVASLPIQVSSFWSSPHDDFWRQLFLTRSSYILPTNLQLKDLQVYTVIRVVFQLSEEIPCISAVVVALLADASSTNQFRLLPTFLIWCFRFSVHLPDFLIKPTSFATYSTIVPTFPQQLSFWMDWMVHETQYALKVQGPEFETWQTHFEGKKMWFTLNPCLCWS